MSTLKVRDLMTTEVVTLSPKDTVKKATLKFAVDNISGAPVVDNRNHLLGILSENDILGLIYSYQVKLDKQDRDFALLDYAMDNIRDEDLEYLQKISDEISNIKVEEIMTRSVLTTSPDETVSNVLRAMISMGVNRLPVVEKGVVIGVISRADIVFALYKRKV